MTEYAAGYDIALAIDEASYHITEDAAGRAYAFQMDEAAREALAQCIRRAVPDPLEIDGVGVGPTHLRVRINPRASGGDPDPLVEYTDSLDAAIRLYNDQHATEGLDELAVGDRFVGLYRPDGSPTAREYIERHGFDPDAEPVAEVRRAPSGHENAPGRCLAWRVVLLTDPDDPTGHGLVPDDAPTDFEWNVDALETVLEDPQEWPGNRPEAVRYVAVHDGFTVADIYCGSFLASPLGYAKSVHKALLRYNRKKGGTDVSGGTVPMPRLEFKESYFAGAHPDVTDAVDEWLETLPELDGEPVDPDTDEPESAGGRLAGLNPLGGT